MAKKTTLEWWTYLIKGIIFLTLAIIFITSPAQSIMSSIFILGIGLLTNGFILIFTGIGGRKTHKNWTWKVSEGVLDVLIGVLLLSKPEITAIALPYMIGAWIMFYGIGLFAESFGLLDMGYKSWWLQLVAGLFTMVLGYLIIFSPDGMGSVTLLLYLQIGFVVLGIYNIIKSLVVLRKSN